MTPPDDTQAALRDLAQGMGRIEGTLEGMRTEQVRLADECKAIRADVVTTVGAIDGRVDGLERRREREMGAAGVAASVAGAVFGFAAAWLKGFFGNGGAS